MSLAAVLVAASVALTGCLTNEGAGGLIGAVTGGVIGNQFGKGSGKAAATAVGAFIGAAAGSKIGRHLDQTSRQYAAHATTRALNYAPTGGNGIAWSNPNNASGPASGVVYALRDGRDRYGNHCREYQQNITVGGKTEPAYGTACRDGNGGWRIVGG